MVLPTEQSPPLLSPYPPPDVKSSRPSIYHYSRRFSLHTRSRSAPTNMASSAPYRPNEEEARLYFSGLRGRPRLIARSSSTPWVHPGDWFPVYKSVDPVGQHGITHQWNNPDSDLRRQIMAAIESLNWTLIDVIRIGYVRRSEWDKENGPDDPVKPITFLISVQPGSTTWDTGVSAATTCKNILQRNGIFDVEVELTEGSFTTFNSDNPAPKLDTGLMIDENQMRTPFTELIGLSISNIHSRREGTKGFYVRLEDEPDRLLAVTCRHVLFDEDAKNEVYRHNKTGQKLVIQPANGTWETNVDELEMTIRHCQLYIDRAAPGQDTNRYLTEKAASEAILSQYHEVKDLHKRVIGHVLFSPRFGHGISTSQPVRRRGHPVRGSRLRDWALIELDQAKYQTTFRTQKNRVPGAFKALKLIDKTMTDEYSRKKTLEYIRNPPLDTSNGLITLADEFVPETELRSPVDMSNSMDEQVKMVAKFGQKTGFTVGVANEVRSVRRTIEGDDEVWSDEWCIMGAKMKGSPRKAFSSKGDSGSCIFDLQGRVAGLLTGGKDFRNDCEWDVTYATPMEWLLNDIRSFGFKVRLA